MISVRAEALRIGANRLSNCAAYSLGTHAWLRAPPQSTPNSSGHTERVNAVAWLSSFDTHTGTARDEDGLVSASSDGTLCVWQLRHDRSHVSSTGFVDWKCVAVLRGHAASVTAVAAVTIPHGLTVIVSTSVDGTMRAWCNAVGEAWGSAEAATDTFAFKSGVIMESVAATLLPWTAAPSSGASHSGCSRGVLVAAGGVDNRVHLFYLSQPQPLQQQPLVFSELLSLRGHLDWIRSLDFSHHGFLGSGYSAIAHCSSADADAAANNSSPSVVYLASASQDRKIRVWRIRPVSAPSPGKGAAAAQPPDAAAAVVVAENDDAGADREEEEEEEGGERMDAPLPIDDAAISALVRPKRFSYADSTPESDAPVAPVTCEVEFDALLSGHEGWVNTVRWHPPVAVSSGARAWRQPPCLLSASMDRTVILWQPAGVAEAAASPASPAASDLDDEGASWSGVWEPVRRLGGGAGGSALGLYGAVVSPTAQVIVAHGYQGALHTWVMEPDPAGGEAPVPGGWSTGARWAALPTASGHFGPVNWVTWGSQGGRYLLSFSDDATTRAWGPVQQRQGRDGGLCEEEGGWARGWVEVGRPQIHGYEMKIGIVPALRGIPHRLFSAGDEKVIRAFDAPRQFLRALEALCGVPEEGGSPAPDSLLSTRADFAYVPELALTAKGIDAAAVLEAGTAAALPAAMQIDGREAAQAGYESGAQAARSMAESALAAQLSLGRVGAREEGGEEEPDPAAAAEAGAKKPVPKGNAPPPPVVAEARSSRLQLPPVTTSSAPPGTQHRSAAPPHAPTAPPPLEADLVLHTRWPESGKLFSHTSEVVALAANSAGTLLASASKARDEATAIIRLWDARTMRLHQTLPAAHKLTVIALAFSKDPTAGMVRVADPRHNGPTTALWCHAPQDSPAGPAAADGEYLVSVSKDRSIAIFRGVLEDGAAPAPPFFALLAVVKAAHKRVIWSVDWAPSPPSSPFALFATGSRDQSIRIWTLGPAPAPSSGTVGADTAGAVVAAAATAPGRVDDEEAGDTERAGGGGAPHAQCSVMLLPAAQGGARGQQAPSLQLTSHSLFPAFDAAVTAVSFSPICNCRSFPAAAGALAPASSTSCCTTWWLAAGLESGAVSLWALTVTTTAPGPSSVGEAAPPQSIWAATKAGVWDPRIAHVSTVRALCWRPVAPDQLVRDRGQQEAAGGGGKQEGSAVSLTIASCSVDGSVRVFCVELPL